MELSGPKTSRWWKTLGGSHHPRLPWCNFPRRPEKRQKIEFSNLKYLLFSGIFLSGIGGYPPPPLNGKSSCPKTLSGKGGYPRPPLNGKNPLSSFWQVTLVPTLKGYLVTPHAPSQFGSLCWRQTQMDHLAQRKFSDQKSLADQLTHLGGRFYIHLCLSKNRQFYLCSISGQ